MSLLQGKRIIITGVANRRSIAYHIARVFLTEKAELVFSYQERLKDRVEEIIREEFPGSFSFPMDVTSDHSIQEFFDQLSTQGSCIDGIIHAIAFAPKDQLGGDYLSTVTREGFRIAHDISSYSFFAALAKAARPYLVSGSSLLTLSYLAAEKAIPSYNVMAMAKASLESNVRYMASCLGVHGVRVNAISPGPIYTLSARAIQDFQKMLDVYKKNSSMKRLVTAEEVGKVACFLCSDYASSVTGEVIHVDAGFHNNIPIE